MAPEQQKKLAASVQVAGNETAGKLRIESLRCKVGGKVWFS